MIDDYTLLETKSEPDATVLTVFRETDKYLRVVRVGDDGVCYETGKPIPADFEVNEADEEIEVGYAAPGWVIRDRLEVMGFTLAATRNVFERGIEARLERIRRRNKERPDSKDLWRHDLECLQQLSFDRWLDEFAKLKRHGANGLNTNPEYTQPPDLVTVSRLGEYLLDDRDEYLFRFPIVDFRFFIRAVIEACGDKTVLSQDLTDVVQAGFYSYRDSVAATASAQLLEDFPANTRVIVLTEGVTDRRALEGALSHPLIIARE